MRNLDQIINLQSWLGTTLSRIFLEPRKPILEPYIWNVNTRAKDRETDAAAKSLSEIVNIIKEWNDS